MRWRAPAVAGLGLGALLACAPAEEAQPDILWVLWDTVRADHLGVYGYERPTRPFLDDWARDDRPWFAFLNYMEAHRPLIPPREYRARIMDASAVDRSYAIDRSWLATWEYTFGLRDLDDDELELTRGTYDDGLLELDGHLERLLGDLETAGRLENAVVVLTSDHGEHLGEQHMLDHQYSLYQPLLRVPLIVHCPSRFEAGREAAPVMNFDLFPTLLELDLAAAQHPDWDPSPWQRRLRALVSGDMKLIWGSDGRHELFRLSDDPLESRDLCGELADEALRMRSRLEASVENLPGCVAVDDGPRPQSEQQRQLLKSPGYLN